MVQGQGIAVLHQMTATGHHFGGTGNVLDYLDDRLAGRQGELEVADQEGAGGLDEDPLVAHQVGHPDIEAGPHQDVRSHGDTVGGPGARAPEEQLVTSDTEIGAVNGLAGQHETAHLLRPKSGPFNDIRVLL